MIDDPRLGLLATFLAPYGVVGVSVPDWSDKSTWTIWYEGSGEINALADPKVGAAVQGYTPVIPQYVLSQDLMAQFTADDLTKIKAAIDANIQFWGLWSAMQAQKDPMLVTNARFLAGWNALVQVLGQPRMDAIATALGVVIS